MFFKVLKLFSKHYRQYNENNTWVVLTNTLVSNANLISHELKSICIKCTNLESAPALFTEINDQLFNKKHKKGVPACSNSFQKEVKPIINFFKSLLSYFDMRDKSADGRSNTSCNISFTKTKGDSAEKNQIHKKGRANPNCSMVISESILNRTMFYPKTRYEGIIK